MDLSEFREELINDIKSQALLDQQYPIDEFTDYCKDILVNDFGVLSDLNNTFIEYKSTSNQYRSMRVDASYIELSISEMSTPKPDEALACGSASTNKKADSSTKADTTT